MTDLLNSEMLRETLVLLSGALCGHTLGRAGCSRVATLFTLLAQIALIAVVIVLWRLVA